MTMGNAIACPHCGTGNAAGDAFCGACGKALPTASGGGPRILSDKAFATTASGQKLQADELQKQLKKATGALLAVAIIQTVFGFIMYAILASAGASRTLNQPLFFGIIFGVAVIFWALYVWARSNPFPAAIAGLVLYVTLWLIDLIAYFATVNHAPNGAVTNNSAGPFNGIIVKIIIIAVLVNAIKAGARYRELQRQQAGGFPVV